MQSNSVENCQYIYFFSYRNSEQMKALWKLASISEKSENGGKKKCFKLTIID